MTDHVGIIDQSEGNWGAFGGSADPWPRMRMSFDLSLVRQEPEKIRVSLL